MRIRRILAAGIATAALAGLGLTGAATATAAQGAPSSVTPDQLVTPDQCREGGGTVGDGGFTCVGGKYNGQGID